MELDLLLYGLTTIASGAGLWALLRSRKKKALPPSQKSSEAIGAPEIPTQKRDISKASAPQRKEYKSLDEALAKTKEGFWGKLAGQFTKEQVISQKEIDQVEEALYTSDLGPKTVDHLITQVSEDMKKEGFDIGHLNLSLKGELGQIFKQVNQEVLKPLEDNSLRCGWWLESMVRAKPQPLANWPVNKWL